MPVPQFDDFWALYPRRDAKARAKVMWARLNDNEKEALMLALPNHVARWKREQTNVNYIPQPASWLNPRLGRRWEDEIEVFKPKVEMKNEPSPPRQRIDEKVLDSLKAIVSKWNITPGARK